MSGCPSTSLEVKASSDSLKCVQPEVYHCLRNQVGEKTEQCIKPSWIQRGLCAEYNTIAERLDAKGCQLSRGLCPDRAYLSNDVISFSGCAPNEVGLTTINSTSSNDIIVELDGGGILTGIIIAIICIVVIGLGVAVLIYFRGKRQGNTNKDEENTEPLINKERQGVNDEEERKFIHLAEEEKHLKYFEYKGEFTKHMCETIKKPLKNHENVIIIGKPGSGKTTLAWSACNQIHDNRFEGQRWYVKASTSTKNLPDRAEITLILLLDGRFENAWTTEGMVEKLMEELKELRNKLLSNKMITIVTISPEAYQRISKYACMEKLKPMKIINLDTKAYTLSTAEMSKVLETYGIFVRNVKEEEESQVLSQKQLQQMYDCFNHHNFLTKKIYSIPKMGFPFIAALMSLNPSFFGNIAFLQEPIKHILESIKRLRESKEPTDKNKYCTIVYASMKWGYVDTDNVDQDLLTKIGKHHGHPGAEIDPEFYVLRKRTATIYEFLHESLLRAFFAAYGSQHLGFVIERCPLQVLLEYSVSQRKNIHDEEKVFFLTIGGIEYEKVLIRRIRDGNVDIRHHRIWEQNGFQELYKKIHAKGDVSNKDINMESL